MPLSSELIKYTYKLALMSLQEPTAAYTELRSWKLLHYFQFKKKSKNVIVIVS